MKEILLLDYGVNGMERVATAVQCFQMGHFFFFSRRRRLILLLLLL